MSMTGMSSLIGYTRLHVAHLSAVPFLTSVTGVLQFGQARISSNSGSTGMWGIYDTSTLLWNNSHMKFAAFIVALSLFAPVAASPQTADGVGEAYAQFLLGHRLEEADDDAGAIAAYTRAMELDPKAADIPAALAAVYLRQNKAQEAIKAAEQALKLSPLNRDANRVLGVVYAALAEGGADNARRGRGNVTAGKADENLTKAIHYLEVAIDKPAGESDPNVRATLARLYVATSQFDKAIPMLSD